MMGPYEEEKASTEKAAIYSQNADNIVAKSLSELDKIFKLLNEQIELLSMLDSRLSPVLHRTPSEQPERAELHGHLTDVVYVLGASNQLISNLTKQLAV